MKALMFAGVTSALFVWTTGALPQPARAPSGTPTFPPAGMQFEKPLLDYLIPALRQAGRPARIYLAATCSSGNGSQEDQLNGNVTFVYPDVNVDVSPAPLTGVAAIRHMLRDDPQANVSEDRLGMTRITIGSVSTAILQTKISHLALSKYDQYTALSALEEVLRAPELAEAERRLHVGLRNFIVDHLVGVGPGPHLPPSLQNVTIDQAFDAIAQTFDGIIVYGTCAMPGGGETFDARFIYNPRD